jgi:alkanesulfonate monooxygenase SsuD/methylene tetrahydromethanopterin reductase-like flavin-dependent oxidoreductase (luciferase family)
MDPAAQVPDQWMESTCALGSSEEVAAKLWQWREAGADEVSLYGSTPAQNAKMISLWRERAGRAA